MPTTLYVGNLFWEVDSNELYELCSSQGNVKHAQVMLDHHTGQSRGFGFVDMQDEREAEKVIAALDGTSYRGRLLAVNRSKQYLRRKAARES